jgi:hypothetical protein
MRLISSAHLRETATAGLVLLSLTTLLTWPAAIRLTDGITDNLDAEFNAWVLDWDRHQLLSDPAHLFDANIFSPARYTLAFSENLLGEAVLGLPLSGLGFSYIQVYNSLLLVGFFSSALAAWALARTITGDAIASLAAAAVYAFVPWRFAQISHFQFQWGAFLALTLLFLLRYLQRAARRDLVLCGVFLLWNALANIHYAIFSILLVLVVLAEDAGRRGLRERLPVYLRVAAVSLVAAALFLPIALLYRKAAALYGFKRTLVEAGSYSGRLSDFLDAGPSRLYSWLSKGRPDRREAFFPGLTALILGALGAARIAAGPFARHARRLSLLLAGLGILIALGTNTPVYPALFRICGPLFQALRVPARGIVLFHLGLAILAALGLSVLRTRFRSQSRYATVAVGVLVLVAAEYAAFPLVVFWAEPRPAPVYRWIAHAPFKRSLIELPFGLDHDIEYVFRSPTHFRPIVNGYSGFFPKEYDALNALFEKRPIPTQAWQEVTRLGAKVVVYHTDLLTDAREVAYARLLRSGVSSGLLVPIRTFDHSGRKDFVFTVGMQPPGLASPDQVDSARKEFDRYLSTADAQEVRPFGWIDSPTDGQAVSPGEMGLGWALARSGVLTVRLATEQGQGGEVAHGLPHPGVPQAHPDFPDSDRAGFAFHVPSLPHGSHPLYLTIVGRDGAEAVIVRWIRVRRPRR